MKPIRLFSTVLISLALITGCEDNVTGSNTNQQEDDNTQTIEIISENAEIISITTESFENGYPAVWFSPSTGEIAPVGPANAPDAETPPEEKFCFWIEPQDPEFAWLWYEDSNQYGVKSVGNTFDEATSISAGNFNSDINVVYVDNTVYFISTSLGNCLIQITELDIPAGTMSFKWEKL